MLLKATLSASPKFIAFEKDRAQCSEWKELINKVSANGTMEYSFVKYVNKKIPNNILFLNNELKFSQIFSNCSLFQTRLSIRSPVLEAVRPFGYHELARSETNGCQVGEGRIRRVEAEPYLSFHLRPSIEKPGNK